MEEQNQLDQWGRTPGGGGREEGGIRGGGWRGAEALAAKGDLVAVTEEGVAMMAVGVRGAWWWGR